MVENRAVAEEIIAETAATEKIAGEMETVGVVGSEKTSGQA